MTGKQYQKTISTALRRIFDPSSVKTEWNTRAGASDAFCDTSIYAPRADIAVGPFNLTVASVFQDVERIRNAARHRLVRALMNLARSQNGGHFEENRNPRCLLAVEIECEVSSKHILGGITNASMMGLVGVVIAPQARIGKIQRIAGYARQLRALDKAPPSLFMNLVCIEADDFLTLLGRKLVSG
jgi:hypothetical protein